MFNRPALTDIVARTRGDLLTRLSQDELLRRSDSEVLSRVLAGASHEIHGYLDWIARQVIYDTADKEILIRWASIWGVTQKPAAAASGNVLVTGTVGTLIPIDTLMKRADGEEFTVTTDTTLGASATAVPVAAVEAGAAGNTVAATALTLLNPIAGVQSVVTVDSGALTNGSDIESVTSLRSRFLARIQQPPAGGSSADYERWALEVPGVTRAWVYPKEMGAGTVTVRFVRDNDASIIPDSMEVQAVQNYIDDSSRRPVTADVYVVAPVAVPLNFTIQLTPATATVKAAVEAELRDLLLREAAPGVTRLISHIREAISTAAGEMDSVLVFPTTNQVYTTGQMPVFGSITWA
ncbi:MuW-like tail protein [Caballeronia novacaledonica]|uniref:MuW-like tail protein n=1 Tax=Caballeronia novacaledonica TaxID=1544861 RepID=A0A2U3I8J7_9BURK|nr:baseplate J/gp47 family protein [Caballeronia novacaledonica]SPB16535.1 MuW-like tail protein [Caballeronia novacaledonica]